MIADRSQYCSLRVTLEAQSAHGIHTGHGDSTHDSLIVRDANGLPTLPGSSIAGVLRHQYQNRYGKDGTNQLFGALGQDENDGQQSWLAVSWGLVHNSLNQPLEGLLIDAARDELLNDLLDAKPIVRQRVRLTEKGTTGEGGKFDTTLIPAGVRYTTLLGYWCDGSEASQQQWQQLIQLLQQPTLRLGHGTRSGAGAFSVQALHHARWDLRTPTGRLAYSQRSRQRASLEGLTEIVARKADTLAVSLSLQAEAGWRVGGGERVLEHTASKDKKEKEPDLLPMHEARVIWSDRGKISSDHYLLPASGIKGALRHRIAYHFHCLTRQFSVAGSEHATDDCEAVKVLFGYAKDDDAQAGILAIHDVLIKPDQTQQFMHNKIDRYTGGVIRGALFGELVLWRTALTLRMEVIDTEREISSEIKTALHLALDDLANGWLPLGAGGSRGLGVFTDQEGLGALWSDQGQWLGTQQHVEQSV